MAFISTYTDPGVVLQRVLVPGAINIATVPSILGIAGVGSREKRVTNEALLRGLVSGETLTLTGTAPHTATLANRGRRAKETTTAFKDGAVIADSFLSFPAATVEGNVLTARDFTTVNGSADDINALVLSLDGQVPVTIRFVAAGGPSVTITGTQIDLTTPATGGLAAITIAEIAEGLNFALGSATALGYGASYGVTTNPAVGVATVGTAGLLITSPLTTSTSDVQVLPAVDDFAGETTDINTGGATVALFGATTVRAATIIEISTLVFNAASTYTVDYITTADADDEVDSFANTGVLDITQAGSYAGVANFRKTIDYQLTGDTIDWTLATPATLDSSAGQPFDLSGTGADRIKLSVDGRTAVEMDLNGLASPPIGYTDPAAPATATAAEVAANINAILANDANYGPRYGFVASTAVVGALTVVRLTSPNDGESSSFTFTAPSASDTTLAVFGIQSSSYPATTTGVGKRPSLGAAYFSTYAITRPTADYDVQKRYFSLDQARADIGPTSDANPLMIATEIAFRNGAPSVIVSQVNDQSSPQFPTRAEFLAAMSAFKKSDSATDIVALSTDLGVQTDLKDHIEVESAPTEKHYRRGWFGKDANTGPGDRDTPNTFVYLATNTLQVAAESPGRGRYILVAPPQTAGVTYDLQLDDGSTSRVALDSTYLAAAIAARMTSFTSPASTLVRQTITGFNVDDVTEPWTRQERAQMASNGVTVVTFDAGNFKLLDPITTERAGGGIIDFEQISASTQVDNTQRKVDRALDANAVGIVPTDIADFIIDIKLIIAGVLAGEIGDGALAPFTNADGTRRIIDLSQDIEVVQDRNNPTEFNFRFWFNVRLPALRLFGQYSVNNPFF